MSKVILIKMHVRPECLYLHFALGIKEGTFDFNGDGVVKITLMGITPHNNRRQVTKRLKHITL